MMLSSTMSLFIFGQEDRDEIISLQEVKYFLFRKQIKSSRRSFITFLPTRKGRFRVRQTDSIDLVSIVKTLWLSTETSFLITDHEKRLKLTTLTRILEKAGLQNLETTLVISQHNIREIIRQFEDSNELKEKLRRKIPLYIQIEIEIVGFNDKPILIAIWDDDV